MTVSKRSWSILSLILLCAVGCLTTSAWAQVTSGSITGVVTDASGGVVPGAFVVVTDTNKGYDYPSTADATGRYLVTNLLPSTYAVKVEAQGFKTFIRTGITVDVAARVAVDVSLQIGATTQTVQVSGAAPVLATQDAVTGQEIDRSTINALPLVDRNVLDLAFLTPGVMQVPGASYGLGTGIDFVSNGNRNDTAEVLVDGIAATSYEPNTGINAILFQPNVDAVQEFKIEQNNYTAEEGYTGTYINLVMRSGTNSFHGSAYEFFRNQKMDANNWGSNQAGESLAPVRRNQFGGSIGGPIRKDKTFFFADFDGIREATGETHHRAVPSAAERQGDFSELCTSSQQGGSQFGPDGLCENRDYQLWDPYSGVYSEDYGGRILQTPIPYNNLAKYQSAGNSNLAGTVYQLAPTAGNIIDPVAQKIMQYIPLPNLNLGSSAYNPYRNWTGTGSGINSNNQFDIRIDQRFTDATAFNVRFSDGQDLAENWNCYGNALDPCSEGPQNFNSRSVAMGFNHTFSPTTLVDVSLGFTRGFNDTQGVGKEFPNFNADTSLGFPSYMATDNGPIGPDIVMYGGYSYIGPQASAIYINGNQLYHARATLTHIKGHHELKVGGEWRLQQMNWFQDATPGGVFAFDQYTTSQYPYGDPNTGIGGDAMASLLTGVPDPNMWGQYRLSPHFSTQNYRWGGFVQDNWRASSKVTVNLGLRYDLEIPRTERYNRMSYFDPTVSDGIQPAAIDSASWVYTNGAGNTVALPFTIPNVTNPVGGLVYASNGQRHIVDTYYKDFGPRFGIAYKLHNGVVLRSGYGLFYGPTMYGDSGAGPVGNEGYIPVTNWLATMNGDGVTPWGMLQNPFPGGINPVTGSSQGAQTNLLGSLTEPERTSSLSPPYSQTWSGGFQYQLRGNWLVDVNYLGNKGTHLYFDGAGAMNYFGSWIEQEATNADLRAALYSYVPNPFYGVVTRSGCGLCGPTIQAYHLIEPYPQFSQVSAPQAAWANSIYNALQIKVEKRMSNGLSLLASYTNSKSIDDASLGTDITWIGGFGSLRDPNRLKEERSLSEWDIPQVFQLSYVWQLPMGRGKKWGAGWNGVVNAFLGGWQTSGIWRFDNGQPVSLSATGGTAPMGYVAGNPDQTGTLKVNPKSEWFTKGYFANSNQVLSLPPRYTIGNASRMEPNTRVPGTSNATLAVFKQFSLDKMREGSRLEFRAEAFNALNHPQFGSIDTDFNDGNFGTVGGQVNTPREVQMALKLYF